MHGRMLEETPVRNWHVIQVLYPLAAVLLFLGQIRALAGQAPRSFSQTEPCPRKSLDYRQSSFTSGGKTIQVEQFQPKAAGKYPIIILVHGSGGLLTRHGTEMPIEDNFGEIRIACKGYVALLVHYFDRSEILSTGDKEYMKQESAAWIETLGQAVDYASSLPQVDSNRIGLLGESLGGYLALSLAMRDPRIKAVSEYGGGIELHRQDDPRRLPPVLIQHGGADSIVPAAEALRLAKVLAQAGVTHRTKIYEALNHYPNDKARAEIEDAAIQFFNEKLKQARGQSPENRNRAMKAVAQTRGK